MVVLLTIAGAVLVLLSTSRTWAHAVVSVPGSLRAPDQVDLSGRNVEPIVGALGLVALAAVIALLATRGIWRVVMGAVIAVVGALIIGSAALTSAAHVRTSSALHDKDSQTALRDARVTVELRPWRHAAAAGGLLVVAGGLVAAARGRTWAGMGRRFEAPAATSAPTKAPATEKTTSEPTDLELWEQLERGEDP